jgi:hypothetical protein
MALVTVSVVVCAHENFLHDCLEELDMCAHLQDPRFRVLNGMLIEGQNAPIVGIEQAESLVTI